MFSFHLELLKNKQKLAYLYLVKKQQKLYIVNVYNTI
jgi:hypothetical protein